ncbi:hypothetical protein SAMN05880574_1281, partial [Chryseobacterium sp. RU37D]
MFKKLAAEALGLGDIGKIIPSHDCLASVELNTRHIQQSLVTIQKMNPNISEAAVF